MMDTRSSTDTVSLDLAAWQRALVDRRAQLDASFANPVDLSVFYDPGRVLEFRQIWRDYLVRRIAHLERLIAEAEDQRAGDYAAAMEARAEARRDAREFWKDSE